MGTVIYVHGTATRQTDEGERDFARMRQRIGEYDPSLVLDRVLWGNLAGAQWPTVLKSIPGFENQERGSGVLGGGQGDELDDAQAAQDDAIARWQSLYNDPFAELRVLALERGAPVPQPSFQSDASVQLGEAAHRIANGAGEPLGALLQQGEIGATFPTAVARVATLFSDPADPLHSALLTIPDIAAVQYRGALARAIVALALQEATSANSALLPPPFYDADLRDHIVEALENELAGNGGVLGLGEELLKPFAWVATAGLRGQRFGLMDAVVRFLGDILAYQGRGNDMRKLVLQKIKDTEAPVTLLAHSLGGIICIDLLLESDAEARAALDKVQLLVTFGSQWPLFYEIDALKSAKESVKDGKLPTTFPHWLNIYDRNDLLSFQAASVLEHSRLADRFVSTGQPFPFSHSAYTERDAFWELVFAAIKRPQDIQTLPLVQPSENTHGVVVG